MMPSRPSLPSTIWRTLGPFDAGGHRPGDERARRRDDAQALDHVCDVAVAVGLHSRGARGDPAAERRVRERVREVPERVPECARAAPPGGGRRRPPARGRGGTRRRARAPCPAVRGRPRSPGASRRSGAWSEPEIEEPPPNGISDRVGAQRRLHDRGRPPPRCRGARPRRGRGAGRRGAGGSGRAATCRGRARRGRAGRSRRTRPGRPARGPLRRSVGSIGSAIGSSSKRTGAALFTARHRRRSVAR